MQDTPRLLLPVQSPMVTVQAEQEISVVGQVKGQAEFNQVEVQVMVRQQARRKAKRIAGVNTRRHSKITTPKIRQ